MTCEAARLEAIGEPEVRFAWRNRELSIPRAVEDWPQDAIRDGRYVDAVAELLNGQTAPIPLYGDVLALGDAMAAAVGVPRLPDSKTLKPVKVSPEELAKLLKKAAASDIPQPPSERIFGAVPLLLWLLDTFEDDIASDLKTYRSVDYLERWRGDLTLRQIWVYIRRLPPTSALALARNGGNELWTKQSIILAQVWERLAGQVYVGRPMTREELDDALEKQESNDSTMSTLADKADYYSPEASRARIDAARQRKAQRSALAGAVSQTPAAAGRSDEPPPAALSALDKAMENRRRDMTTPRKAG